MSATVQDVRAIADQAAADTLRRIGAGKPAPEAWDVTSPATPPTLASACRCQPGDPEHSHSTGRYLRAAVTTSGWDAGAC